jgi:chorismate synthase
MRFLTAGESHGPELTAIVEGMPAGLAVTKADVDRELARRQMGYGSGARMQIETDRARLTAGIVAGRTTGGPIALVIENRDFSNWRERDIAPMTVPRPGHADLTGAVKYGYSDLRFALERASARETAARVAAGAVMKRFLAALGVDVYGYVLQIGPVSAVLDAIPLGERAALAEQQDTRCPDAASAGRMHEAILQAKKDKDTLGGVIEIVATGMPPGIGSYAQYDRRLDARLAAAVMGVQAMKGVAFGDAFAAAGQRGSAVHDPIDVDEQGRLVRRTNEAGGVEGGISTGEPIMLRVAMKPIATLLQGIDSVDLATGKPARTVYERSDICAVPRAVPVLEAMVAWVLADMLHEKLGGDSMDEILPRLATLRQNCIADLDMANAAWRFGYEADG